MLDLSVPKVPFDIALPYGLSVTVRPVLSTGGQSQARVSSVVAEVLVSIAEDEPEVPVSTGNAVIICVVSS